MKLSEQQLLEIKLHMEELITARCEMLALNDYRSRADLAQGYDDRSFRELAAEFKALREQLIVLGER